MQAFGWLLSAQSSLPKPLRSTTIGSFAKNGHPVTCGINWGGFYALDIEVPEVKNYIKHFFDVILNDWGFDLVKLDFLYAAAIIPNHGKSRGQLMCEAMDFLRECVGEK